MLAWCCCGGGGCWCGVVVGNWCLLLPCTHAGAQELPRQQGDLERVDEGGEPQEACQEDHAFCRDAQGACCCCDSTVVVVGIVVL